MTGYKLIILDMENRMNYTKAIVLLVSGIVSLVAMLLLGEENQVYGFLTGYGYTAFACGIMAILYTYLKDQKSRRRNAL
ncbi:hypothetical protein A3841_08920 [Pontibacter flavimaris]|uniref:Uncharacterized protein n=1 Tax=Pontibacter flavimaris TaxID=1797110 RepID=A0A1Q5PIR2_9BACT|nr:hypothetical protein A3841_08920 [Pontibacter flavimaris]